VTDRAAKPAHKPTPYQAELLAAVARGERTMPPDGTPDAGRHAAHWWRATTILCKAGLLTRGPSRVTVSIPVVEVLPEGPFEEKITGKSAAYARAEHLRNLGRQAQALCRSGAHYLVRVGAAQSK
jgi:hypothetical protein